MSKKEAFISRVLMPILIMTSLAILSGCGTGGLTDAPVVPPTTPKIGLSVSVVASPSPIGAGQTSIITATVTGDDMAGTPVTFSLPVNNSGASFINTSGASVASITVTTSGSGIAEVIYQAGANSPGAAVQDTARAALINGANGLVILTRTASSTGIYAVTMITPSPASVTAGQVSIITATVTRGGTEPATGVNVNFTLPVNSSGATLSSASGTTDGDGKVVVVYLPGTINPDRTVQDTVQAAVGAASNTVVVTRIGSATSAYSITVSASPSTLTSSTSNSVVTATVRTKDGTGISGLTVTFAVSGGGNGTVAPLNPSGNATALTDASGNATTIFTGGGDGVLPKATDAVTASITIDGKTYSASTVITYP